MKIMRFFLCPFLGGIRMKKERERSREPPDQKNSIKKFEERKKKSDKKEKNDISSAGSDIVCNYDNSIAYCCC